MSKRKVTVEISVEAETEDGAENAVKVTLQAAGLPGECFRILAGGSAMAELGWSVVEGINVVAGELRRNRLPDDVVVTTVTFVTAYGPYRVAGLKVGR